LNAHFGPGSATIFLGWTEYGSERPLAISRIVPSGLRGRKSSATVQVRGFVQTDAARSNPAKQNQDQEDDNYKAQSPAAVVAGPIERTATKPAKPAKQDNDQDYYQYGSDRHGMAPLSFDDDLFKRKSCAVRRGFLFVSVRTAREE
jgi:hypothetical protein